jgi:protein O-GlcNAc transferase
MSAPDKPADDGRAAAFAAALALHQGGKLAEADAAYRALLQRWPGHVESFHHVAILALQRGQLAEAETLLRRLTQAVPQLAAAWSNLGVVLLRQGRAEEAAAAQRQALAVEPGFTSAMKNLGNALRELGDNAGAEAEFRRAIAIAPDADGFNNLGLVLQNRDPDGAIAALRQAVALDPAHRKALASLANILRLQGRIEEGREAWDQAIALKPEPGLQLMRALTVNPIIRSRADIEAARQGIMANIAALRRAGLSHPAIEDEVFSTNFFLAYHGRNNRELHSAIAALYAEVCPNLNWVAPHCTSPRRQGGRIKVGFLSQFMRRHSIGRTTRGLIAQLDSSRFESHAIFVPPLVDDEISRFIREAADHHLILPKKLAEARQQIAALELDVLFYQDIGMEPYTYFLAFSRLAPVQCVSFGHPDTTGIPTMDYFISNDLFEVPEADAHYSEKLFRLHDLGTLAYYYKPETPNPVKPRSALPVPQEGRFYLCPQHLFKVHPDFDDIVAGILERDAEARVCFIAQGAPRWAKLTFQRLANRVGDKLIRRVFFVPSQDGPDFLSLLRAADVVLDTVHFNGMNTSLESLSQGAVVVTLPSDQQRGRHTQAMYRKMGITETIARDAEDYVNIAVRVATDDAYRADLQSRISAANHVLFEDPRVVREFERFYSTAVAAL